MKPIVVHLPTLVRKIGWEVTPETLYCTEVALREECARLGLRIPEERPAVEG